MPGVLLEKVADKVTQRNFERLDAAIQSLTGNPLRNAVGVQGTAKFSWLKQPISNSSNTVLSNSGVGFDITDGVWIFQFLVFWQTVINTTGLALGVAGPTSSLVRYGCSIHQSATAFQNAGANAYNALVISTGAVAATTTYHAVVEGLVKASEPGRLQLQFRSEVNASAVTLLSGTNGMIWRAE